MQSDVGGNPGSPILGKLEESNQRSLTIEFLEKAERKPIGTREKPTLRIG